MPSQLIIIPTYKEEENIAKMIDAVLGLNLGFHILVIEDNSPDRTAEIVKEKIAEHPGELFMVERSGKLGLGTAYIKGFRWAIERKYDYILEMDADFSHKPMYLKDFLNALNNNEGDVVIGSRYTKGGGVKNWPMNRVLLSKYASVYVRLVTWIPVKDTTAGYVAYKREVLEGIDLDKISFVGYAFQIEMKFAAWKLGYKLKEIPIIFEDRIEGVSKMTKGIFKEAVWGVLKMKWKSLWGFKYGTKKKRA